MVNSYWVKYKINGSEWSPLHMDIDVKDCQSGDSLMLNILTHICDRNGCHGGQVAILDVTFIGTWPDKTVESEVPKKKELFKSVVEREIADSERELKEEVDKGDKHSIGRANARLSFFKKVKSDFMKFIHSNITSTVENDPDYKHLYSKKEEKEFFEIMRDEIIPRVELMIEKESEHIQKMLTYSKTVPEDYLAAALAFRDHLMMRLDEYRKYVSVKSSAAAARDII